MGRGKWKKRLISIALILAFCCNTCLIKLDPVKAKTDVNYEEFKNLLSRVAFEGIDYKDYLMKFDTSLRPDTEYVIEAKDYVRVENMEVKEYIDFQGMEGISILTQEQGLIEYEVDIKEEGLYDISLLYYPVEGNSASIQRGIFIDGELPYSQLDLIEFPRIWVNAINEWEQDNRGNDLNQNRWILLGLTICDSEVM